MSDTHTTTNEDRRKELDVLLAQMRDHPSGDWDSARERVAVLQRILASNEHQAD